VPNFHYRAYSNLGDLEEGDLEALSHEAAEDKLWSRGLTPFETSEVRASSNAWTLKFSGGLSLSDIASFSREFATLEEADVPLDQSLRILSVQSSKVALRDLANGLLAEILDGSSLSEAIARRPSVFSQDFVNILRAGETTGDLATAMVNMADMLERRLELRSRVFSALVYPSLLIALAIVAVGIVLGVLVPSIAPIFEESGKPVPGGLQFVMALEHNWPIFLGALIAIALLCLGLRRWASRNVDVRLYLDRLIIKIPVVGPLKAQMDASRFARTLGTMLKAGVPLLQSLASARAIVTNDHLGTQIETATDAVRNGESLSRALAKVEGLPALVAQIVAVGEEASKLDAMLLRTAVMFERQTYRSIERAMSLLTPMLTIGIATLVGGLIFSVMNAVLEINDLAMK
jgi:general secretion pathway protein F